MSWHLICYLSFQLHVMTSYLLSIISTSCHDILFVIYHFNFMSWHLICYLSFQLHVMTSYLLSIISTSCHDILFVIYHFNFMSWHLICLGPLVLLLPIFKLFGFPIFWFECTWWRLFHKRVVCTKFDIYVFIVIYHFNFNIKEKQVEIFPKFKEKRKTFCILLKHLFTQWVGPTC